MRTLFSEQIRSPPPEPVPERNPFELLFCSSTAGSSTATTSSHSSPRQRDWLTQDSQHRQRENNDLLEGNNVPSSKHAAHGRRKGNPKILLMGQRRSGKSSIQNVVFQKLPPAETLYLDTTTRITTKSTQTFTTFEITELPSHIQIDSPAFDHRALLSPIGAVIWVLDVQDEYLASLGALLRTATFLAEHYPRLNFAVFVHKTDGLSEEYKHDTFREIRQRVQDELADLGYSGNGDGGGGAVAYYQTSIFDHSVFEAMSKVVQSLLPQLSALEHLLNSFCSACRVQKAYLFDTVSKIYVATDASPTFLRDYEVCSDYVDVIIDIKELYGWSAKAGGGSQEGYDDGKERGGKIGVGESLVTYDRSGDTYIYVKEITEYLSLLCIMGKGSSVDKRVLIDYNVSILQDALLQVFKV